MLSNLPDSWSMLISFKIILNLKSHRVIKKLGERVEKEHGQFLRDSQRNEDRSAMIDPDGNPLAQMSQSIDFQSLVSGSSTNTAPNAMNADVVGSAPTTNGTAKTSSWEDDVWGSILDGGTEVSVT
jgi:SCY1-like protein 2